MAVTWDVESGSAIYIDGKVSGEAGPGQVTRHDVTQIKELYIGAPALKNSVGHVFIDELYIFDRPLNVGFIAAVATGEDLTKEPRFFEKPGFWARTRPWRFRGIDDWPANLPIDRSTSAI